MRQSFKGREDATLTDKLLAERPGILNLALEALDRLRERDRFIQPGSGSEMSQELEEFSSHIALFIAECCDVGPEYEATLGSLYLRWRSWCAEKGIRYGWDEPQFSQKLTAQVPAIIRCRRRRGDPGRPTWMLGIRLKPLKTLKLNWEG